MKWLYHKGERVGIYGDTIIPTESRDHIPSIATAVKVMSADEVKKLIAGRKPFRERYPFIKAKNQNPYGACNGYSAAGSAERQRVRRGLEYVPLHGCSVWTQMNNGRNVGTALAHAMECLKNGGAAPEDLCPGRVFLRFDEMDSAAKEAMKRFICPELYKISNEAELATAAALEFDIGIAVHVDGQYNNLDSKGRMTSGNGPGNHAVGVDDIVYDNELGCFTYGSMGSWDDKWGDDGYCRFIYERQLKQSINYHDFYAIRTTIDDPDGDNPPAPRS